MAGKRHVIVLSVILLVLVAGCLPQPSLRSELFLDDRSLVSGEPCVAPCWNGIVPGETTWTEAITLVQNDEAFAGFETEANEGLLQAIWQKAGSEQFCCRLLSEGEEEPVSYVFLALSPGIIVDEVLRQHGDPTYVTTFDFTDAESVIQLIYPDQYMVISVVVGDSTASLLANSDVVAVLYMSPGEMQLILDTTELQAWNGYQSYSAYQSAPLVVTPIYTLTPPAE
ncbi:MAG: hypothetical protein JXN59_04220 [Anaerolineae bacterium]|nr:hypothetical protein [Anaerolineae bacterium]